MVESHERIVILGASRGLGRALAEWFLNHSPNPLWLGSRKISILCQQPGWREHGERLHYGDLDFTSDSALDLWTTRMAEFQPTRIFYCAGGGPFGPFQERPWQSHLWAFTLNLIFPARLLHSLLAQKDKAFTNLQQIVFIGSAIAENAPDPGAASYASAKHGLKGLVSSFRLERPEPVFDVRLYSPGYMDTSLLPPQARPRQDDSWIADPAKIADDLVSWALTPPNASSWHRILTHKDQLR